MPIPFLAEDMGGKAAAPACAAGGQNHLYYSMKTARLKTPQKRRRYGMDEKAWNGA
jgi:hypothetical protein